MIQRTSSDSRKDVKPISLSASETPSSVCEQAFRSESSNFSMSTCNLKSIRLEKLAKSKKISQILITSNTLSSSKIISKFDIILLDIMLPDGDGRDFLKKIRKCNSKKNERKFKLSIYRRR